ncbi:MAG: hypothetical protein RL235_3, partial [Chlamydiota bacterium]
VVLAAVRQNGLAFRYASPRLKRNREAVLAAVQRNGTALMYASEDLQRDRGVILAAVRSQGIALRYVPLDFPIDLEIVLAAVRQDGLALYYAPSRFCDDRAVVLEAVRQDGRALEYASEDRKNDRDVVFEAVRENGLALKYASQDRKGDRDVVFEAVRENGLALEYASEDLKGERDVVLEAVRQNGLALEYASEDLQGDREVVLEAVRQNGLALEYAHPDLRRDLEIVRAAVEQNEAAIIHVDSVLQDSPEFDELRNRHVFTILVVNRERLASDPLLYLARADVQRVIAFEGEMGLDVGGLTREFVSLLMNALDRSIALPKQATEEGIIPKVVSDQPGAVSLPDQIRAYRSMGIFFGRALVGDQEIVLGHHFHPVLFSMLHALTEEELARASSDLPMEDPISQKLIGVFIQTNLWSSQMGDMPESVAEQIEGLANAIGLSRTEFLEGYVMPSIRAALAIASGIQAELPPDGGVWNGRKGATPSVLCEKVEGVIDREQLKIAIHCAERSTEEQDRMKAFFRTWVDNASDEELRDLLRAATGAEGFLPGSRITLTLAAEDPHRFVVFHTCSRSMDVNVTNTYESFSHALNRSIKYALTDDARFDLR